MVLLLYLLALAGLGWVIWNLTLDALWQPTDHKTISQILESLNVNPDDRVYDLGCGDGRWLTRVVRDRGARATGVEIDPLRAFITWLRLVLTGNSSRAQVIWGNMYDVDLTRADVVILFLSEKANSKLVSKLNRELPEEARVASFYHKLPGWNPVTTGTNDNGHEYYVYQKRDDNDNEKEAK